MTPQLPSSSRSDLIVLIFLGLLAFLVRAPSFLRSVIDWDESLYFLMAQSWRAGNLPYTTLFDNKPVGIYVIFAVFQMLLGDNILAIRIAAVVAVTATAYLVFKLCELIFATEDWRSARVFAGLASALYVVCSIANGGMASNTELFMSPFTCLALYLALTRTHRNPSHQLPMLSFIIGILSGAACLIKPVAIFELPAVCFVLMRAGVSHERSWLAIAIRGGAPLAIGMLAPVALVVIVYAIAGELPLLVQAIVLANVNRIGQPFAVHDAADVLIAQWHIAPIYLGAAALVIDVSQNLVRRKDQMNIKIAQYSRNTMTMLLIWIVGAFAGVLAGKDFYDHYFLQLLPPLSVTAAWALGRKLQNLVITRGSMMLLISFILLGFVPGFAIDEESILAPVVHSDKPGIGYLRDVPAQIAATMAPELERYPGRTIFIFNYEPIIYSLVHVVPPTKYAFPFFLIDKRGVELAGVDVDHQIASILATDPLFIVITAIPYLPPQYSNVRAYSLVEQAIDKDYVLWRDFSDTWVFVRQGSRSL